MDSERARDLLAVERSRVEQSLGDASEAGQEDRAAARSETGDIADPAERLTAEAVDDAVVSQLRTRLAAIERAEDRLIAGTYGLSVRSGKVIPDERLEADPAAELTADEATE